MVELVVIACLEAQPETCTELRVATGFASVANCEQNALILVAGVMLSRRDLAARSYHCIEAGSEYDT